MSLDDLMRKSVPGWMREPGPESDTVLSSRIRLARNIAEIPFPAAASDAQLQHVDELVASVVEHHDKTRNPYAIGKLVYRQMVETPLLERQLLIEKHLISPQHAQDVRNKAVVLSSDELVSVMVNEEDHLRIQAISPGLQLDNAFHLANMVDDLFDASLEYAFSPEIGYLTACPTNVGTGLRASVMVHLPALVLTGQMQQINEAIGQFGLTVRGIYGEGSEAVGNIYQISNQATLGRTEQEIIDQLKSVVEQIIRQERQARTSLMESNRLALEDRVWRAYGILAHARVITTAEALGLLSMVRLGIDLGLIAHVEPRVLQELVVLIRPGHIQHIIGRDLEDTERDMYRASLIRERLKLTR